ncbi:hypothetical protein V9T40_006332 [Parthenolecanium corni]|uniref:Uncharacterized protein n=1 Tax=Parthenolecanium corni TaxID=536013 RepID=A0AAN9TPA7_9HEMI
MLIVAIQFSQIFAAPAEDVVGDDEDVSFSPGQVAEESKSDIFSTQSEPNPTEDGNDRQSSQYNESRDDEDEYGAQRTEEDTRADNSANEHLSHMLTQKQEFAILHQVPEFTNIIRAMEQLPDGVYGELKNFLESTVPRMPDGNLFTQHFKNAAILVQMFERLVQIARNGGTASQGENEDLFNQIHQAAPEMKKEMNDFNRFIEYAQPRFANLGTTMTAEPEKTDSATGGVTLPVERDDQEGFANDFDDQ